MQINIPSFVNEIMQKFQDKGFEVYIVGGAVRDLLMNRTVKDWDLTTNATPEQILEIFPEGFYDNQFGTVGVPDQNKNIYEITTYRSEVGYSDRRHPDKVVWGETLQEDLGRRDFTINAMALTFNDSEAKIIDPFDGQKDIEKRLIRAVGEEDRRFSEDALRMMRAIRIATEIGFQIEGKTFEAIKNNAALIKEIASERIREELFRIFKSDYPDDGVSLLLNSGLLEYILPELIKGFGLAQAKHHIHDVWTHSLLSLKHTPSKDPIVRFATLIHDIGKPVVAKGEGENRTFYNHEVVGASIAANIADRLKFSRKQKEKLVTLVRWHQFTVDEKQTDSAIRRFIRNVGKENLEDMLALRIGDRLGGGAKETSWRLEKFKKRLEEVQQQPFSVTDLKINGKDVMEELDVPSGPLVGKLLNSLFDEVVEGKTKNERETLLKRMRELWKEIDKDLQHQK